MSFTAGPLHTVYRIDRGKFMGTEEWKTVFTSDDHALCTSEYERLRNLYKKHAFRLVAVIEHVERHGRGQTYD